MKVLPSSWIVGWWTCAAVAVLTTSRVLVVPVDAWSSVTRHSSFTGTALQVSSTYNNKNNNNKNVAGLIMYDHRGDPPSDNNNNNNSKNNNKKRNNQGRPPLNAWNVLATTEEWISNTLSNANAAAAAGQQQQNPYTRKEVSYVCETSADQPMIVANIFKRLKEARVQGQEHGESEQERAVEQGSTYRPNTLRQTQVVVIPSNPTFSESFPTFDKLIETINASRRHARDYVTGTHLDRMDDDEDDEDMPWSVSVNCAHLHPAYGTKTPEQELQEMQEEEEAGEVDVNYKHFLQQRQAARRSPYPTIVVEVRASPPPDFGAAPRVQHPPTRASTSSSSSSEEEESPVTADDIQKLEALFGQSAHMNHPTKHLTAKDEEEDFYARIGNTIQELSAITPMQMAQEYIASQDPHVPSNASFTISDAQQVDEAYEFVFTNLAMMAEQGTDNPRYYVVLPYFCAASATSLEKFTNCVQTIAQALPDITPCLERIDTYHPEHILPTHRAPVPVLCLQWKQDDSSSSSSSS